jgi:hypothetical protein
MDPKKEAQILAAVRRAELKKKRVTFFITEESKDALAAWCREKGVTESGTIEQMIKATVPVRFFEERR